MSALSRRDFTRLLALSGSTALLPSRAAVPESWLEEEFGVSTAPLPPTPAEPDEKFWRDVRAKFLVPREIAFINAANLAPMSLPVVQAIEKNMRQYELNPSPEARSVLLHAREDARN